MKLLAMFNWMRMAFAKVLGKNYSQNYHSKQEYGSKDNPNPNHFSPLSIIIAAIAQTIKRIEPLINAQIFIVLPEIRLPNTRVAKTTVPAFWRILEAVSLCLEVAKMDPQYRKRLKVFASEPIFIGLETVEV